MLKIELLLTNMRKAHNDCRLGRLAIGDGSYGSAAASGIVIFATQPGASTHNMRMNDRVID